MNFGIFIKYLGKRISVLDFLSYKPQVLYKGKENFQTTIGGTFSILTVLFLFGFSFFFFYRLFERATYNLASNTMAIENPIYNRSGLPFIFKLIDGNGADVANDSTVYRWEGLVSGGTATFGYYLAPCDKGNKMHFGEYSSYFEQIYKLETFNCLDNINKYNMTLAGLYENNEIPKAFINIITHVCQNKTNSTVCKPKATIDTILTSVYVKYLFLEHHIDHNNISSPGSLILQTEVLSLSSSIYKRYNLFHSLISYKSDYGYLFPEEVSQQYFQKTSYDVSVDMRTQSGASKFGQICLFLSKNLIFYSRTYDKIQDVIAKVGGVISSILVLSVILLKHVTRRLYLISLANENFVQKSKDSKRHKSIAVFKEEERLSPMRVKPRMVVKQTQNTSVELKDIELGLSKKLFPIKSSQGDSGEVCEMRSDTSIGNINMREKEEREDKESEYGGVSKELKVESKSFIGVNDFKDSLDKNGKIKKTFKNIFYPSRGVQKVFELIENKSGQDALLNYSSQIEKMKRFVLNSQEEITVFNNLPDLDFEQVFEGYYAKKENDLLTSSITKIMKTHPESKILKMVKDF